MQCIVSPFSPLFKFFPFFFIWNMMQSFYVLDIFIIILNFFTSQRFLFISYSSKKQNWHNRAKCRRHFHVQHSRRRISIIYLLRKRGWLLSYSTNDQSKDEKKGKTNKIIFCMKICSLLNESNNNNILEKEHTGEQKERKS